MRFGIVILPDTRWSVARERWQAAEAFGFDCAWTYDHLTWRSLRDGPWFGAVPTLTAAATATSRIRLGTLIASPNFRHPVPFAKELMSLDDISGGRFTAGLGAGGSGFDATALGQEAWRPRERADRFEEFVEMLDRLLIQPETNHDGRFYSASEARGLPGCVQRPRIPFAVAGSGPRGMRLAARFGETWVTLDGPAAGAAELEKLDAACAAVGRDPATLGRLVLTGFETRALESPDAFQETVGRYRELGYSEIVVHWPRDADPFEASLHVLERIAADGLPR